MICSGTRRENEDGMNEGDEWEFGWNENYEVGIGFPIYCTFSCTSFSSLDDVKLSNQRINYQNLTNVFSHDILDVINFSSYFA